MRYQIHLKIQEELIKASFLERLNRFSVLVDLNGEEIQAHLPNSGRLKELLVKGRTAFLVKKDVPWRKTCYDMALVALGRRLVSVDARLPGDLVEEALRQGRLGPFETYNAFRREVVFGDSRLDFELAGQVPCLLEVKSVTKVRAGVAMFPDAVTARGTRHIHALLEGQSRGLKGAVAFVVQRDDARSFSPDDETDPRFGETLRQAVRRGLLAHAFKCQVSLKEVRITGEIPVKL